MRVDQHQRVRARYTNQFVRTPALVAEEAAGRALWPGITGLGSEPGAELVGPELAGTMKDLPGINVVRHAGRLLALHLGLATGCPTAGESPSPPIARI